jgi:N-acyl-D-aspartate/D-glutamate deacylase
MTSLPAQTFGLRDRGELREGAWADIVVFDPAAVDDVATYDDPRQYPAGIDHVIVNGAPVVEFGGPRARQSGQVLSRG